LNAEVLGEGAPRFRTAVSRTSLMSAFALDCVRDFGAVRFADFFAMVFVAFFFRDLSGMTSRVLLWLLTERTISARTVLEYSGNY
jgi:hypothetical protein